MKKILIALTAIFTVAISFGALKTEYAYAVNTPYVVIGEDIWLLDDNGGKIFILPETYYARILSMDDNYYYVSFNGVNGKIPKNSVSVVGYDGEVKNTAKMIHIASEYSVFTEIKLKSRLEGESNEDITVPTGEALTYLGSYKQGDVLWYFVSYEDKSGYIKSSYTDSPEIKYEKFVPINETSVAPEVEKKENETEERDLTKILIIAGVSVAAIVLLIIIFLPRKNKKHKYYYS